MEDRGSQSGLGRRSFLGKSAAGVAGAALAACAPGESGTEETGDGGLSPATLQALGRAVLPSELGPAGIGRAVSAFREWAEGIEPVAELSHAYLSPELRYGPPDPRPGWKAQLEALDVECLIRHDVSFTEADIAQARALLEPVMEQARGLGSPMSASHVSVALAAHFFSSPGAIDLCYGRQIGAQQCRGLEGVGEVPAALESSETTT